MRGRQPTPIVVPRDLEFLFFPLRSPFIANHDRIGHFRLIQVLRVISERHHHKRGFVCVSSHAIVTGNYVKVGCRSWIGVIDEWNLLKSQRYLAKAFEGDRIDFDVLSGIAAQVVDREYVTAPLVVLALYRTKHDPRLIFAVVS